MGEPVSRLEPCLGEMCGDNLSHLGMSWIRHLEDDVATSLILVLKQGHGACLKAVHDIIGVSRSD